MADGILCLHCGWQETDHEHRSDNDLLPGRKKTLNQCKEESGFTPEDPELAEKLAQEAATDAIEQRRRRGFASADDYD